ncbi:hypothetical protein Tco_1204343 [Tanacetum coccineum]
MPSRLRRFVVANFNEKTYSLSLDTSDKSKVTHKKIHDILGVPFGGYLLFDLEERPVEHEFARLWVGQFFPKALRDIRVNDIASKLGQICLDVVRRLREDCAITDIDWCGYIYDCLKDSKLPTGSNHYLGPLAFLILELKDRVLGLLELHGEWTKAEGQETKGFMGDLETSNKEDLLKKAEEKLSFISNERVLLEDYMRKASLEYSGDGKFVELYEKYVKLFKEPISFNDDDGNGDDDTRNGDDDGNGDDDAGVDNDVNEDDDDNGDDVEGNDSSVNDKEVHVEDDGNHAVDGNGDGQDDNGSSKKQVESTRKQLVDPTDPTGEESVFEEENDITCTPESYTQWLDENANFVLEFHALDAINEDFLRMEESDAGRVNPDRLATHVSNLTKTTSMTILYNSDFGATYDSKYKKACDLLKNLFTHHMKLYGHQRHSKIQRLKAKILKLNWKTTTNFRDYGIFTMLHMESYTGQTTKYWDCGLVVESKLQCDMLRRLRFKYATKVLLHEINVHAPKMLELAKEFDKLDSREKLSIVVGAVMKREEREHG